jgi:hypothetical protein
VLLNNGMFGTIRMHQEREYPQRRAGTELRNPDFVALAQAYGYAGGRITRTEEFEAQLLAALSREQGTLIEVMLDPEVITTRQHPVGDHRRRPSSGRPEAAARLCRRHAIGPWRAGAKKKPACAGLRRICRAGTYFRCLPIRPAISNIETCTLPNTSLSLASALIMRLLTASCSLFFLM